MKKLLTIAIATVLMGLSGVASAKSHVCTADVRFIEDHTVFSCTRKLPNMTFSEMIQKGYRVVSVVVSNGETADKYYTYWAVVIEK